MSAFADAMLLLLVLASLTLAIIALVNASTANRRARELDKKIVDLRDELTRAMRDLARRPVDTAAAPATLAQVAPLVSNAALAEIERLRQDPAVDLDQALIAMGSARVTPVPEPLHEARAAAREKLPEASATTTSDRVERAVGLVWATRIGAAMLLSGVLFFFKVAVDKNWLGPWARIGLGVAAGLTCIGLAAWLRKRLAEGWVGAMVGLGLAILLASAWVAHGLYHLVPAWVAFAALSAFAVGAGMLALAWRLEAVLVSATSAGFLNLAALSGGFSGHAMFMLFGAVLGLAALFTAVRREWLLAVVTVPLGLVPGLVSRHLGSPDALASMFGPALPAPGGIDTVVALAIALVVAVSFVIAARRLFAHRVVGDLLLWSAVILPLSLAAMLLHERLPLAIFVAVMALVVALERHFFERPRTSTDATGIGAVPLEALHIAMHGLGALVLLIGTAVGPGPVGNLELVPALAFVLIGLASASDAPSRPTFVALELAILSAFAFLWSTAHGSWSVPQPVSLALPLVTAAALGFVALRERRLATTSPDQTGADPVSLCASIASTALIVIAIFRMHLPDPWTCIALAGLSLVLMTLIRKTSPWVAWLAVAVLGLAFLTLSTQLSAPDPQRSEFLNSEGLRGAYFPAPFIGAQGLPLLAIAAVALAFRLVAGAPARPRVPGWWPGLHTTIRVAGFVLALAYVLDQTSLIVSLLATSGVNMHDIESILRHVDDARDTLVVALTALLALFGAAVLAWGFSVRSRLDRWVGLIGVGLALLKLVTYDLSVMDSVARTVVLVCFGALLLASGFLYARFAPGMKSLLRPADAIDAVAEKPPRAD